MYYGVILGKGWTAIKQLISTFVVTLPLDNPLLFDKSSSLGCGLSTGETRVDKYGAGQPSQHASLARNNALVTNGYGRPTLEKIQCCYRRVMRTNNVRTEKQCIIEIARSICRGLVTGAGRVNEGLITPHTYSIHPRRLRRGEVGKVLSRDALIVKPEWSRVRSRHESSDF